MGSKPKPKIAKFDHLLSVKVKAGVTGGQAVRKNRKPRAPCPLRGLKVSPDPCLQASAGFPLRQRSLPRALEDHLATLEHQHIGDEAGNLLKAVGNNDKLGMLLQDQPLQQAHHAVPRVLVQSVKGLVQYHKLRAGLQNSAKDRLAELPTGQQVEPTGGIDLKHSASLQPDELLGSGNQALVVASIFPKVPPQILRLLHGLYHLDLLGKRDVGHLLPWEGKLQRALQVPDRPTQGPAQGRLSRAVAAEDKPMLARVDFHGDFQGEGVGPYPPGIRGIDGDARRTKTDTPQKGNDSHFGENGRRPPSHTHTQNPN
eukprot:RCo028284